MSFHQHLKTELAIACYFATLAIVLVGCPARKAAVPAAKVAAEKKIKLAPVASAKLEDTQKGLLPVSQELKTQPDASTFVSTAGMKASAAKEMPPVTPESPKARSERLVIFTPAGPLIVELEINLRGRPLNDVTTSLLNSIFMALCEEKEMLAWSDLLKIPMIAEGQLGNTAVNARTNRRGMIDYYDRNRDGDVRPEELLPFLTQNTKSERLFLVRSGNAGQDVINAESPLWSLLDTDENGQIDDSELTAASDRIRTRDSDDNEVVSLADLTLTDSPETSSRRRTRLGPKQAGPLDRDTTDAIFYTLCELSGTDNTLSANAFKIATRLPGLLDRDRNGKIEQAEMKNLPDAEPDLKIRVCFLQSDSERARAEIELIDSSADLTQSGAIATVLEGRLTLKYENWTLDVTAADLAPDMPAKIDETAELETLPRLNSLQILVRVEPGTDPLFDWIDLNRDGALSLREILDAEARVRFLDKNRDGTIIAAEVPMTLVCEVIRGEFQNDARRLVQNAPVAVAKASTKLPAWLVAMDQNSDGEVSNREFLGSAEKFRELDENGDGFLESDEFEEN